ncbi:hypothetical protein [Streptomyces sp. NBC_01803]|uniref:hypothetical protein n=1 Tax=Streptomyces sp. NBC_01803 TaxID=2975946 RepID=UPI002DDC7753|nr:hypothetical protein [Streptomyces sp. NBC_01803]WSA44968.1 hypothetical protein OIE51_12560 [Streptomyces sp. NBC_01803]
MSPSLLGWALVSGGALVALAVVDRAAFLPVLGTGLLITSFVAAVAVVFLGGTP